MQARDLCVRFGGLRASLVLGVLWAAWHLVMFALQGLTPLAAAVGLLNVAIGSVIFSWLYGRTRGSLAIAILAHLGAHLNNPVHAMEAGDARPFHVYTAAVCVTAAVLVLADRRTFGAATRGPST